VLGRGERGGKMVYGVLVSLWWGRRERKEGGGRGASKESGGGGWVRRGSIEQIEGKGRWGGVADGKRRGGERYEEVSGGREEERGGLGNSEGVLALCEAFNFLKKNANNCPGHGSQGLRKAVGEKTYIRRGFAESRGVNKEKTVTGKLGWIIRQLDVLTRTLLP